MQQAARNLTTLRQVAPTLQRVLVLNEVSGGFDFDKTSPQGKLFHEILRPATRGARVIGLPLIAGQAFAPFQAVGLSVREALSTDPHELAKKIGRSLFITHACLGHLTAWWDQSREGLDKVIRFQSAEDRSVQA